MYIENCSNDDPEKWEHYDMKSFREASTKDQLANAISFKYDKNNAQKAQ